MQRQVWHAQSLSQAEGATQPSGFAALDAELPGGGWPVGALTEVLHAGPHSHAWPLLLPALARAVAARGRPVVLVGAPHAPFCASLAAGGVPPAALLWIRADAPAARLWACEQALRCADVAAVLAWLPQSRPAELRRLQLAAAQHGSLVWVFRPAAQAGQSSPARLRLQVAADGHDRLAVQVIKRRGPPLDTPLTLPAHPPRLAAVLAAAQPGRSQPLMPAAAVIPLRPLPSAPPSAPEPAHALDRPAVAA